ncbi:MAG TPA: efflux RND transporter periplasmic adaptor subunit [Planctomycetaceae bacterium]|nr:efflux RND transporter periplasmic adaptor subunit [Planctomycetaceae bacterium]
MASLRWIVCLCFLLFAVCSIPCAKAIAEERPSPTTANQQPRLEGKQLVVSLGTVKSMQLTTGDIQPARQPQSLRLTGQLVLDPAKLVHVTTRFSGEVVRVASADEKDGPPIRIGEKVKKGQLLAKIWSREIGEKKSDLVDALSQLYLDESIYRNLKVLEKSGAIQQRSLEEMQRSYESGLILVERVRRTLTSWRIAETEMAKIEIEARRIHAQATAGPSVNLDAEAAGKPAPESVVDATWGEIQILSPIDGTILEKNLTVGDIVGTEDDLFKIADIDRLMVMANIYEEDLDTVAALPVDQRVWRIEVNSQVTAGPVRGVIEVIGDVIDPSQHTAILTGPIDNSQGAFRIGQFAQTVIDIPAKPNLLQIPLEAIIDAGARQSIFVSRSGDLTHWERIELNLARRTSKFVWATANAQDTLHVGDKVLTRGCLELSSALDELSPASDTSAGR